MIRREAQFLTCEANAEEQGPTVATGTRVREAGIKRSSASLMRNLLELGSYGEGKLKMWLTHRYFEQVKQAERLAQNGNGMQAHHL
jgi:hypothetical protein